MEYKIFYRNKFIPNKSISVPYFDLYKEQEETAKIESFLTSRHPGVREITKSFLKGRP